MYIVCLLKFSDCPQKENDFVCFLTSFFKDDVRKIPNVAIKLQYTEVDTSEYQKGNWHVIHTSEIEKTKRYERNNISSE